MKSITEHSSTIKVDLPQGVVTSKMEVFYNPEMISNRNMSILLLNTIKNKDMKIALPLAGSGIRALRFLQELKVNKIKKLYVNDKKESFPKYFKSILKLNKGITSTKEKKIQIHNKEANHFLLQAEGLDYIDLDPFGTPNPFLASAIAAISRDGILAVTATDTAALTGTYKKVTRRKYWAESEKNWMMHETALRILIRKVQLQGIQFDKALTPVLSYHKNHYFRIYFRAEKGKQKCDKLLKKHNYILFNNKTLEFKTSEYNQEKGYTSYAGPLWVGNLFNKTLLKKMNKDNQFPEEEKFLNLLTEELDQVGFYDLHVISKLVKTNPSKFEIILEKSKGTRTHFSVYGIKSKKSLKEIKSLFIK